jgi:hypothetical protein
MDVSNDVDEQSPLNHPPTPRLNDDDNESATLDNPLSRRLTGENETPPIHNPPNAQSQTDMERSTNREPYLISGTY